MTPFVKFSSPSSSSAQMPAAIFACCAACCVATASRSASTAIVTASSCATMSTGRWKNSSRVKDNLPSSAARSPQAKGRIERLWGTFQDRLTSELRLAGAADMDAANQVLRRFLPDYNRRFGRAPRETEKAWRPAPQDLDRICCFRHERKVSNDN